MMPQAARELPTGVTYEQVLLLVPDSNTTSGEITTKVYSDLSVYWQGFFFLQKLTWENRYSIIDTQSYNHPHTVFNNDRIFCHFHLSMFLTALWSKTRLHNVRTVWMDFEYDVRIWYNTVICTEYSYCTCHCVTNSYFIYMFLLYLVMRSVAEII